MNALYESLCSSVHLRIESPPVDWVFLDSNLFGHQDVSLSITQDKNSIVLYDKMFDFTKSG